MQMRIKSVGYSIVYCTEKYFKVLKSIHWVNSSAQRSCSHKMTADVSSGQLGKVWLEGFLFQKMEIVQTLLTKGMGFSWELWVNTQHPNMFCPGSLRLTTIKSIRDHLFRTSAIFTQFLTPPPTTKHTKKGTHYLPKKQMPKYFWNWQWMRTPLSLNGSSLTQNKNFSSLRGF